jgi:3-deoxy-manno-octulosonate cytidylyltransferase (CMP-KDO synthetase)
LAHVAGHSLISRVLRNANRAEAILPGVAVIVATDDIRIADHVEALGARAVMTSSDLPNGSARSLAALRSAEWEPEIVVNLQGDAPFISPATISALVTTLRQTTADIATPVVQLDWNQLDQLRESKRITPFSGTTCVRGRDGRALWFSKAILPLVRHEERLRAENARSPVWHHLGLYAFRLAALERFEAAPVGLYESYEELEQLRMLEAGESMVTVDIGSDPWSVSGVDSPEDVQRAEAEIALLGDPHLAD